MIGPSARWSLVTERPTSVPAAENLAVGRLGQQRRQLRNRGRGAGTSRAPGPGPAAAGSPSTAPGPPPPPRKKRSSRPPAKPLARRGDESGGSRCSGRGSPPARRRSRRGRACRASPDRAPWQTATSRIPGCRTTRTASRGGPPSPAARGAARPSSGSFRSSTVNSALPSRVGRNRMQALTAR